MSAPPFEFRDFPQESSNVVSYASSGKRALDLALLFLMSPVILPVMALLLFITALTGGAPLYFQDRVGQDGHVFRCWKIRTMVRNADRVLQDLLASDPALAAEWAHKQKLSNDPRVTWFGALLRRSSLDELPQLWNVLNGTMSLVGPRPFLPAQRTLYLSGSADAPYYRMRPGLTGLWQISKRSQGTFAERAVYDGQYAQSVSLAADLGILLRTFAVVVRGTGV
jgi:exopolysaccharide production protein ExoY